MKYFIILIYLALFSCKSLNQDLNETFYQENKGINLYAFVGKKLSVIEFDPNNPRQYRISINSTTNDTIKYDQYIMDLGFNCQYLVVKKIFNDLNTEVIEFKAYDHYGRPAFENYNYSVMYVSMKSDSSGYFHQKYQFDPVKMDKNGNWIGLNGESLEKLFKEKKEKVLKGLFD